jgi:tRNA(Ile)-lysidine synthase
LHLPGGVTATRSYATLELAPSGLSVPSIAAREPLALPVPGELTVPGGWRLSAAARARLPADPSSQLGRWAVQLDAHAVRGPLAVRGRRAGDRLQPLGLSGRTKSVQDLFVDARVPRRARDSWPLVVVGDSIVWIPGLRLDERFRVTPATARVLELSAEPPPDAARALA